jgi:hypothetical protein
MQAQASRQIQVHTPGALPSPLPPVPVPSSPLPRMQRPCAVLPVPDQEIFTHSPALSPGWKSPPFPLPCSPATLPCPSHLGGRARLGRGAAASACRPELPAAAPRPPRTCGHTAGAGAGAGTGAGDSQLHVPAGHQVGWSVLYCTAAGGPPLPAPKTHPCLTISWKLPGWPAHCLLLASLAP